MASGEQRVCTPGTCHGPATDLPRTQLEHGLIGFSRASRSHDVSKHKHKLAGLRLVRGQSATWYESASLIHACFLLLTVYAQLIPPILAKLRFHRHRPEFNGLFEYEEHISLKGVNDPNEGCVPDISCPRRNFTYTCYETISDLMNLQGRIQSLQKLIFVHFQHSVNNECRISALPTRQGIVQYLPFHNVLRAMHRRTGDVDALEPLRSPRHHNLRQFYFECSNLEYLTGLTNAPKPGADPPNPLDNGQAPELPKRPTMAAVAKAPTPPPAALSPEARMIVKQAAMLKEYEDRQRALEAQKKVEEDGGSSSNSRWRGREAVATGRSCWSSMTGCIPTYLCPFTRANTGDRESKRVARDECCCRIR